MSGRPRSDVIDESKVGVYHVWNRCIRQMFLFGADRYSGRDYTSRKALLAPPTPLEIRSVVELPGRIDELRKRLSSISWFMKSLDEWLAKRVNAMDKHRGHLWQDRFGCRNLLDEGAILVCSIYIDLNEIRAGLAATPAKSCNTSAYLRTLAQILRRERATAAAANGAPPRIQLDYQFSDPDIWICPLDTQDRSPLLGVPGTAAADQTWDPEAIAQLEAASVAKRWRHGFLPLTVDTYLDILERTISGLAAESRDSAQQWLAPILAPLGIRADAWFAMLEQFETWFHGAVGSAEQMLEFAAQTGRAWIHGLDRCRACFE